MTTVRRWFRHPVYTLVLAAMWTALQGELALLDFAIGCLVATVIVHWQRDLWRARVEIRRPARALRLAAAFAREIVLANLQVARIVIRPRVNLRPAFIKFPLVLTDDVAITTLANMITLTPGTLTVDVAPDRSALWVHCLSVDDVDEVRRQIDTRFQRPLAEVLRCSPL